MSDESNLSLFKLSCFFLAFPTNCSGTTTPCSAYNRSISSSVLPLSINLKNFDSIYAAAGHPNAVFEIDFENLKALTSGETKEITE